MPSAAASQLDGYLSRCLWDLWFRNTLHGIFHTPWQVPWPVPLRQPLMIKGEYYDPYANDHKRRPYQYRSFVISCTFILSTALVIHTKCVILTATSVNSIRLRALSLSKTYKMVLTNEKQSQPSNEPRAQTEHVVQQDSNNSESIPNNLMSLFQQQ